jgi:tetratricopeptide (TPR) repeat protein
MLMQLDKSILIFFGMIAGFVSIYLGYLLFLKGIEGSSTLEGEVKKVKLSLRNASPGLFFALFGAAILISGIYKQDIHSLSTTKTEDGQTVTIVETTSKGTNNPSLNNEILQAAKNYQKNNNYLAAEILYFLTLQTDDTNYEVHNNLANIYLAENQFDLALSHVNKTLKNLRTNDQKAEYYYTLAQIFFKKKEPDNALRAIQDAVRLEPSNKTYQSFVEKVKGFQNR